MTLDPKAFESANKAAVDSLVNVANAAISAAERIVNLNFDTTRNTLGETAVAAKSVLGASDAEGAVAAQKAAVEPVVKNAMAYSKSLYEISTDVQQQLSKLFESQIAEFQRASSEAIGEITKNLPAGSETYVQAMQEAFQKANTAINTATAMTKQMVGASQSIVEAAAPKKGKAK